MINPYASPSLPYTEEARAELQLLSRRINSAFKWLKVMSVLMVVAFMVLEFHIFITTIVVKAWLS